MSEPCDHVEIDEPMLPPDGVIGIHLNDQESVEIDFNPKQLSDAEVEAYARNLQPEKFDKCIFRLSGRACEACALKLEKKVELLDGVRRASATFIGGSLSVTFDGGHFKDGELLEEVRAQGAPVAAWSDTVSTSDKVEMVFTVITLLAMLVAWIWPATRVPALILAYFTGGTFGVQAAWQSLKEKTVDVDLLMILAALGAAYVNAPMEGAVLLFLFSLSNVLQAFAIDRTRQAIHSLMKLRPEKALVRRDDVWVELALDDMVQDDLVMVKPGEAVPLDGEILEGRTSLDESSLTGESLPVSKQPGDPVFAGTINQSGSIEFRVTRLARDSTIAKLVQMVEVAQSEKANTQRWMDQAEQYYAAGVILVTIALIAVPMAMGGEFDSVFYRAITVMVVASPCALVISTPASILSAIGGAARRGVLFKGGAHLERAAEIDAICFDKTGTLTEGKPRVTDLVVPGGRYSSEGTWSADALEFLALAASVESRSEHPLAAAIVKEAHDRGLELTEPTDFTSVSGKGASATVQERRLSIGSARLFADQTGLEQFQQAMEDLQGQGKTAMLLADEEKFLGIVAVADVLRPDAVSTLKALRAAGLKKLVMLTGDNQRVAEAIAKQAGIDEVFAELLPQDKVEKLNLLKKTHKVAMVGDGVNDAPALATADLGIAMGAAGSDVALESADVVFMGERLEHLPYAFSISRRARRVMVANLSFALTVIVVLVIGSLGGNLPLPLGVLGHEGSTVLVCLNGLRLLFHRD
jgi:Zn2+/Cd2+-exporting ATPase